MTESFLIGGGWSKPEETFGRFAKAATDAVQLRIALILLVEEESLRKEVEEKYRMVFSDVGVSPGQMELIWISPGKPFPGERLREYSPTGVFVGGGTTPLYHGVLCGDGGLADFLKEKNIPYGGFSAGAAIASRLAVIGGWMAMVGEREVPVVDEECSEELEWITVTRGLGLVPFSIDVHAGQWGNLSRLVHVVEQRRVETGWGIDEDTMMQVDQGRIRIWGSGQVYRVERTGSGRVLLEMLRAGEERSF